MSFQKPGGTTSGTTSSTTTLPPWFQSAWLSLLGQGNDLNNNLNFTTAGLTPDQMTASALLNGALKNFTNRPQIPAYDVFGMGQQWNQGGPMAVAQAPGVGGGSATYSSGPSGAQSAPPSTYTGTPDSPLAAAIAKLGLPASAINGANSTAPYAPTSYGVAQTGWPYVPSQDDPFTGWTPDVPIVLPDYAAVAGGAGGGGGGALGGASAGAGVAPGGASGGPGSFATNGTVGGTGSGAVSGASSASGGFGNQQASAQQSQAQQADAVQAEAAQLRPADITPFMNSYTQYAIDPALQRMRQQELDTQAQIAGKAAGSGMFGGSRQAVSSAIADRDYRTQLGETAGGMLNTGFNNAAGLAGANVDRRQNTNLANAQQQNAINQSNAQLGTQSNISNAQLGTQSSIANANNSTQLTSKNADVGMFNAGQQNDMTKLFQQLLFSGSQNDADRFLNALNLQNNMDNSSFSTLLSGVNGLNQLGTQQQSTAQNGLNSYWTQLNNLAKLLSAGGNPGSTTSGTTSGSTTKPVDLASILLGGAGLLSDRKDKTDIERLGRDPVTGLEMYAYRYKNDPKTYPKVVGPMADEIEQMYPGSTRLIGGHRVITG